MADRPIQRSEALRRLGWFTWLNGWLATAISVRYVPFMGALDSTTAQTYLPLALYGHFTLLAVLVAVLFAPLIVVAPRSRWTWSVAVAVASVMTFALIVDTVLYGYYRFHLNAYVLTLLLDAGGEVIAFSWVTWLTGVATLIGVVGVEYVLLNIARRLARRAQPRRAGPAAAAMVLLCLLASSILHIWADAVYSRPVTSLTRHIPAYRPITAKSFLQRTGWIDISDRRKARTLKLDGSSTLRYPLQPLTCTPADTVHNLVLIVIDNWRGDALSDELTPHISRFTRTHPMLSFSNHFSAGNGTRPGIFGLSDAMMTSSIPPDTALDLVRSKIAWYRTRPSGSRPPLANQTHYGPKS